MRTTSRLPQACAYLRRVENDGEPLSLRSDASSRLTALLVVPMRTANCSCVSPDFLRLIGLMQEHGADLRLPHSRAMGDGLFELRCKGTEGIGRAFYCTVVGRRIVIVHSLIKKTQETPQADLRLARKRVKEVHREN